MKAKKFFCICLISSAIFFTACQIRITSSKEEGIDTAVAQTVLAQQQNATLTAVAIPTNTSIPTNLPTPTSAPALPTETPRPCNKAAAISETYLDDTEVTAGTDFDKSWRLQNIGTCTWQPNYRVIFYSGDQMGGPNSQTLNKTVAPGEITDIVIDQKAPNSPGTYKGIWQLQDDSGAPFAQFWVQIKAVSAIVPEPTSVFLPPSLPPHTYTANSINAEGGSVRSNGEVRTSLPNVGDVESNASSQAFVSFDISGIPAGATITEVKVNFSSFDTLGDPFGDLGCLRAYKQNYGTLDASDFVSGSPLGAIGRWCSTSELHSVTADDDFKNVLQGLVGSPRFQIRLQFNEHTSDNDSVGDMVRFGNLKLEITYL